MKFKSEGWFPGRNTALSVVGQVPRDPRENKGRGGPPPNFLLPRVWAVARVPWGRRARPLPERCHGKLRASDIPGCPPYSSKAQRDEGISGPAEGSLSWEPGSPVRAPALP